MDDRVYQRKNGSFYIDPEEFVNSKQGQKLLNRMDMSEKTIKQDGSVELQNLLTEMKRVTSRLNAVTNRVNKDEVGFSTYTRVLKSGTKEGVALKRSLLDLRMQISQILKEI